MKANRPFWLHWLEDHGPSTGARGPYEEVINGAVKYKHGEGDIIGLKRADRTLQFLSVNEDLVCGSHKPEYEDMSLHKKVVRMRVQLGDYEGLAPPAKVDGFTDFFNALWDKRYWKGGSEVDKGFGDILPEEWEGWMSEYNDMDDMVEEIYERTADAVEYYTIDSLGRKRRFY